MLSSGVSGLFLFLTSSLLEHTQFLHLTVTDTWLFGTVTGDAVVKCA